MTYSVSLLRRHYVADSGGYVALMATIVISALLLVLSVEGSVMGWYARFNVLGTEAKEQAATLAQGCADQALSAVVTDPSYTGDATTSTAVGSCYVFPVAYNSPTTGVVTVRTQARVRGSFVNQEMQLAMNQIHIDTVTSTSSKGTLVVLTTVVNTRSGTKSVADFGMQVVGYGVSSSTFRGSVRGKVVTLDPGTYQVTGTTDVDYLQTLSPSCTGTITAGSLLFCTVTYTDAVTSLSVLATIKNDAGGLLDTRDLAIAIDGVPVTVGQTTKVSAGSHIVSMLTPAGYTASEWGQACSADGRVTVASGEEKTCTVTVSESAPALQQCSELVTMLDRTTNLSTADLPYEKSAASALVALYSTVPPTRSSRLAFGSSGGIDGSAASIPTSGQLSTSSAALFGAITALTDSLGTGGQNLSAVLTTARTELASPRHVVGTNKAVLIISNGVATTSEEVLAAADILKDEGATLYTVHYGADPGPYVGKKFLANLASGSTTVPGHRDGSASDVPGIITSSTGFVSPTAQSAATGGDGNGFEVNPEKAFSNDHPAGLSGAAQNNDGGADRHIYTGYQFNLPPGATIVGIQVRADWWLDSTAGTNSLGVELSWDGGATWTTSKIDSLESTAATNTRILGRASDLWGHTWTVPEVSATNFKVRLTMNATQATRDFYLDWIPVSVAYSVLGENADRDNFFVAQTANDLKDIMKSIGATVCPATLPVSPITPPTNGLIHVRTHVITTNGGSLQAPAVPVTVTPTTALPRSFGGSEQGSDVIIPPGNYVIKSANVPAGYTETRGIDCSGAMHAGDTRVCELIYDDIPQPPPPPLTNIHLNTWRELPSF